MSDGKFIGKVNIDNVMATARQFIKIIEKKNDVVEGYFALKVAKAFIERDSGITLNTELEIDELINKIISNEEDKSIK